tara:strand:- start:1485 stop:1757 length:273 start_codon:yes stop_codon:yes gene_type:complete
MANRTLPKGAEAACPTTTGTASTFGNATVVRLINNGGTARLVTVVEEQSGTVVGSFTMAGNTVEYVEKDPTYAIFAANAAVLGAKVGFTN